MDREEFFQKYGEPNSVPKLDQFLKTERIGRGNLEEIYKHLNQKGQSVQHDSSFGVLKEILGYATEEEMEYTKSRAGIWGCKEDNENADMFGFKIITMREVCEGIMREIGKK